MTFAEFFALRGREALELMTARRVLIYLFAALVQIAVYLYWYFSLKWSSGWDKHLLPPLTFFACGVVLGAFTSRKWVLEAMALAAWQALVNGAFHFTVASLGWRVDLGDLSGSAFLAVLIFVPGALATLLGVCTARLLARLFVSLL